jgi:hypothetical protein
MKPRARLVLALSACFGSSLIVAVPHEIRSSVLTRWDNRPTLQTLEYLAGFTSISSSLK